jgi:hypothetical protein
MLQWSARFAGDLKYRAAAVRRCQIRACCALCGSELSGGIAVEGFARSINPGATASIQTRSREACFLAYTGPRRCLCTRAEHGRVEMWRGGGRLGISVSAPFVWRCLTGAALAPFPHPAHRTGRADFPPPALGQGLTPSPTARGARARPGVPGQNGRTGARVDSFRPFVS